MISLDKYNKRCNVDELSKKICVPIKTKDVKIFTMITMITEVKAPVKHTSCDCKCKFNSTACNSNQKWNNDNANASVKCECIVRAQKFIVGVLAYNSRYLKSIIDGSVMMCDDIINVANSVSTNGTYTLSTNVTNTVITKVTRTVPINSDGKNVRYKMDCYILYTVLLVDILLFIIPIACYHCEKFFWHTNNVKMEKDDTKTFFDSIIMLRFGKTKVAKEQFHGAKKSIKIFNVNGDSIVISKLV